MEDDFSPDAAAAFDKLAALKRRYQNEADPVAEPELLQADDNELADTEDIPVLTEAVIIAEPVAANAPLDIELLSPDQGFESELVDRVIEKLRPELQKLLEAAFVDVMQAHAPAVYDAWLNGLRQRARQAVQDVVSQSDQTEAPQAGDNHAADTD